MKSITTQFSRLLIILFFVFGISHYADAAFPGKQKDGKETATLKSQTENMQSIQLDKAKTTTDDDTILLVILAILLPPLAVYLKYNEVGTPFIVNVILTCLFWFPGIIHALYHVLK